MSGALIRAATILSAYDDPKSAAEAAALAQANALLALAYRAGELKDEVEALRVHLEQRD